MGDRPTPEQILDLKICDPAMGSGAFLVEACRLLGDKLVQAWNAHGGVPKIPPDEDPQLYARRIVAQRCLYGVDKNPFAVDLAKLSLWLATLARDHPFTFLDHALRCGDSLVGLTREQIACFNWEVGVQIPTVRPVIDEAVKQAEELRHEIHVLSTSDDTDEKSRLLRESEDALDNVRLIGDLATAAFFGCEKNKEREELREKYESKVRSFAALVKGKVREKKQHQDGGRSADRDEAKDLKLKQELRGLLAGALEGRKPIHPFHWEIEFPEVFSRENPGFDALVGNPPFAGRDVIAVSSGPIYIRFLQSLHADSHGNSDLVAQFFRRAFNLLRSEGCFGLIATNTIAQGDTRSTGLRWICTHGGTIYAAQRRYKWPAGAAVTVSIIHAIRGRFEGQKLLDGNSVPCITAFLFHQGTDVDPSRLRANQGKSHMGSVVVGVGFTFDDTNPAATGIAKMHELIAKDARNAQCISPFIGGEEVNDSPIHAYHRYVINFGQMQLGEAAGWPDLLQIVETKVRPERERSASGSVDTERRKQQWWLWGRNTPALYEATRGLRNVLAISCVTQHLAFAFLRPDLVYSHRLIVFTEDTLAFFAIVQSRVHEVWARFFSSTLEDRLNYTPSDCFETFAFAPKWEKNETLERVGKQYYEFRADLMVRNNEGLTATYNRFHDPDERAPDIFKLRELHEAMDRAVLDAYGWTDLKPTCEFILDYEEEEDDDGKPSRKKKPWRYRWPDEFRDEVLARLLALNQERAAQEKAMGNASGGTKKKPRGNKKISENRTLL